MENAGSAQESWYEVYDGPDLMQGDILQDCAVHVFDEQVPAESSSSGPVPLSGWVEKYTVAVLTQSCDLAVQKDGRRDVDRVVVCPVWSLSEFCSIDAKYGSSSFLGNVRSGRVRGWYVMEPCRIEGYKTEHLFLEMRRMFIIPIAWAESVTTRGPRLRLRSPWREHVGEAVGTYFGRVALPSPVSQFPSTR